MALKAVVPAALLRPIHAAAVLVCLREYGYAGYGQYRLDMHHHHPQGPHGRDAHPNKIMDQALALQQFGGDLTFLQMCPKFVSSGRGLIERIQALVDGMNTANPDCTHADIRREALAGAASTIERCGCRDGAGFAARGRIGGEVRGFSGAIPAGRQPVPSGLFDDRSGDGDLNEGEDHQSQDRSAGSGCGAGAGVRVLIRWRRRRFLRVGSRSCLEGISCR